MLEPTATVPTREPHRNIHPTSHACRHLFVSSFHISNLEFQEPQPEPGSDEIHAPQQPDPVPRPRKRTPAQRDERQLGEGEGRRGRPGGGPLRRQEVLAGVEGDHAAHEPGLHHHQEGGGDEGGGEEGGERRRGGIGRRGLLLSPAVRGLRTV